MVHWNELCCILATNSFQSYTLPSLTCVETAKEVDIFSIKPVDENTETLPLRLEELAPSRSEASSKVSFPLGKSPGPLAIEEEENTLIIPPPILRSKEPAPAIQDIRLPAVPSPRKSFHLSWSKYSLDPIVLGLEKTDILYNDVTKTIKKQKEIEEALRIEERISELYKSQGGRSRGWTKALLEAIIKPRCASGGDLYELKSSKSVFLWQMVCSDKPTSAVLDFLCVAKQIRVAIWSEEKKTILIFPAADYIGEDANKEIGLYNVSDTGLLQKSGLNTGSALVKFAQEEGWTLLAPHSVIHSLEKLTLAELASVGEKLGMGVVEGSKVERIAAIVSFKLKSRLRD